MTPSEESDCMAEREPSDRILPKDYFWMYNIYIYQNIIIYVYM